MTDFEEGDRVRIDIPDEADPDHRLHGEHGEVAAIIQKQCWTGNGRPTKLSHLPRQAGVRRNS